MQQITASTISLFLQHQDGLTDMVYGVFGLMDFGHVYRHSDTLSTTLKVAHVARGVFYILARLVHKIGYPSPLPFLSACLLGVGLHGYEAVKGDCGYHTTKNTLGAISDIAYIIFCFVPHPVFLGCGLMAASVKFMMSTGPVLIPCCRKMWGRV
jgi:hypothetical protein